MRYVIVDLEATCWDDSRNRDRMEIIEIGAVEMPAADSPPGIEFSAFVRPTAEPLLSDFCRRLTTIRQQDVDRAENFPSVFGSFLDWIGDEPFVLCSWGEYDLNPFRADCARHKLLLPASFERHKKQFASLPGVRADCTRSYRKSFCPLSRYSGRGDRSGALRKGGDCSTRRWFTAPSFSNNLVHR